MPRSPMLVIACTLGLTGLAVLGGCGGTSYRTMASSPADMQRLVGTPDDPNAREGPVEVLGSADFPTNVAIARVQARSSRGHEAAGPFALIASHDVGREGDKLRVQAWPQVVDVVVLNRLIVPDRCSDRDLRAAAGRLGAGVTILYTFDTDVSVDRTPAAPLGVVTLGAFPGDIARVRSTVSAVALDTRTGFIHMTAEAAAEDEQLANAWTQSRAVDQTKRRVERWAFERLLDEMEKRWVGRGAAVGS